MKLHEHRKSVKSNMESVYQSMQIEFTPKKGWQNMKRLPRSIRESVLQSRAKIQERREMIKLLNNHPSSENKFVFLVVNILDGSFSPVGFSKLFDTHIEVINFAKSIGRQKVKIGKNVFDVDVEIEREAARIVAAEFTKNNYIKFGYWRQGD